jgi:hypothetical protein
MHCEERVHLAIVTTDREEVTVRDTRVTTGECCEAKENETRKSLGQHQSTRRVLKHFKQLIIQRYANIWQ